MEQQGPTPASHESPEELRATLDAARRGCAESEARLIETCRAYLLSIANKGIESGLRPKVAASDAVQETIIEAQRDLSQFRGESEAELLAWLRKILQNNLSDAKRRYFETGKRDLTREQSLASGEPLTKKQPESASNVVSRDEEAERMRALVAALPDDYQQVIRLRNWELKSFEEIGSAMDRSAEAARKLWGRAITQLREQMRIADHGPQQEH